MIYAITLSSQLCVILSKQLPIALTVYIPELFYSASYASQYVIFDNLLNYSWVSALMVSIVTELKCIRPTSGRNHGLFSAQILVNLVVFISD